MDGTQTGVAAGAGQCHQGFLHGGVGPVLGQQLAQFLSTDAARPVSIRLILDWWQSRMRAASPRS